MPGGRPVLGFLEVKIDEAGGDKGVDPGAGVGVAADSLVRLGI